MNKTCSAWHYDEMRFGLWGQVRRRWGRKGVRIIQKVQIEFAWEYLVLAVDVVGCTLRWDWVKRMSQEQLIPVLDAWSPDAIIWDGETAHRGKQMAQRGFERIFLPPYSPELNPPERVFEEIRRQIEGKSYPSLKAKRLVIERILRRLNADKAQLQSLVAWDWIVASFEHLPEPAIRRP
ncbi:MAG: transposase [Anaerolineae bacterium]|nr:transposase [Anaerolineae bacterium]